MCLPFSIFVYHVLLWCRTLRLSKVNDIFETRLIYLLVIIVRLLLGNSLFKLHLVLLCCHYLVLLICQYGVLTGRLLGCCLHLALSGLGRTQNCSDELVLTVHQIHAGTFLVVLGWRPLYGIRNGSRIWIWMAIFDISSLYMNTIFRTYSGVCYR